MERLDKLAEQILEDEGPESPLLVDLYEVCPAAKMVPRDC